jgi:DNA-binding transcriptional LysR family regulator
MLPDWRLSRQRGAQAMQIRHIDYFLTLCEELNFTRAARRCRISQPSLTNAIMTLEAEFGGPLFHRRPVVQLTVLGHTVKPHLTRIRLNMRRALDAASGLCLRQQFLNNTDIRIAARPNHRMAPIETKPVRLRDAVSSR